MLMMKKIKLVWLVCLVLQPAAFTQEAPAAGARLKPVSVDGKWGYADSTGKVVIAAQFDAAQPFTDGLARVGVVDGSLPEVAAQPNLKWGYIDERGRVMVELRYAVLRDFSENLAAAAVLDAKQPLRPLRGRGLDRRNLAWGYVDRSGREIIPVQFLDAGDFSEGLAAVNVAGEKESYCGMPANYGYIDKAGTFHIMPRFARAASFQNGRARVSVGRTRYLGRCVCCGPRFVGKHGQVDRSGTFTPDKSSPDDATLEFEDWENR